MNLVNLNAPRIAAQANWGRWVVRCPRCPSALTHQPGMQPFVCWDCGQAGEIVWPSEQMAAGVERLLMMRPDVSTRNWLPGETLSDLLAENAMHGILCEDADLLIIGDEIVRDTPRRLEVA